MPYWLITGSSRGIGFELATQLAANPANTVFAASRTPSSAKVLNALAESKKNVHVVALDVDDEQTIRSAAETVKGLLPAGKGIDYLINNAGWASATSLDDIEPEVFEGLFKTHVTGTFRVFRAFLPLVRAGERKVVVNVSSELGSLAWVDKPEWATIGPAYAVAKAAQNMLTRKIAKQYPDLCVFAFGPGWIKTEMGGANAKHEVGDAVAKHIKIYEKVAVATHSGKFINLDGEETDW